MKYWRRWTIFVSRVIITSIFVQKRGIFWRRRIWIMKTFASDILKIFGCGIRWTGNHGCVRIVVIVNIGKYCSFLSIRKWSSFLAWQRSSAIHVFRMSSTKAILGWSSLCIRLELSNMSVNISYWLVKLFIKLVAYAIFTSRSNPIPFQVYMLQGLAS